MIDSRHTEMTEKDTFTVEDCIRAVATLKKANRGPITVGCGCPNPDHYYVLGQPNGDLYKCESCGVHGALKESK